MSKRKRYVIGIDPGLHTGFAVWDRQLKDIVFHKTMNFWNVYLEILGSNEHYTKEETLIVIENPVLNKPVFQNKLFGQNNQQALKIAQNVGSNKREAELLIKGFRLVGYEVREVKPTTSKWTVEHLKRLTGISERTSAHTRDAIKICWQM